MQPSADFVTIGCGVCIFNISKRQTGRKRSDNPAPF